MQIPKLVLAGLSAACLVSSCASAPSVPSATDPANASSPRYKLFTLEKECPQTCNAAFGSGRGGIGQQSEFQFFYRAVDSQIGPDLLEIEFSLDNEFYSATSGTVTINPTTQEVNIVATVSNGSNTLNLQIRQFGPSGDSDVFVTGIDAGAGIGAFTIIPDSCVLPPPV